MTFDLAKAVAAGGSIFVPAGTYAPITIKKPCALTLDPKAILKGVSATDVDGIEIHGGQGKLVPTIATQSFSSWLKISGGKGHRVSGMKIVGGNSTWGVPQDADPTIPRPGDAVIGLPTGRAMTFSGTTDVEVSKCDISGFFSGINFGGISQLAIRLCKIHDLRTTPIHGTVVSGLTVDGCFLYASRPWRVGGKGDHCAAIHIWTDANLPGSVTSDIVMTTNSILDNGGHFPMGIETEDNSAGGFANMLVDSNHITMGAPQGLVIDHWQSGRATNNRFQWTGGPDVRKAPSIRVAGASPNVVITGNTGPDTYHALSSNPGNTVVPVHAGIGAQNG